MTDRIYQTDHHWNYTSAANTAWIDAPKTSSNWGHQNWYQNYGYWNIHQWDQMYWNDPCRTTTYWNGYDWNDGTAHRNTGHWNGQYWDDRYWYYGYGNGQYSYDQTRRCPNCNYPFGSDWYRKDGYRSVSVKLDIEAEKQDAVVCQLDRLECGLMNAGVSTSPVLQCELQVIDETSEVHLDSESDDDGSTIKADDEPDEDSDDGSTIKAEEEPEELSDDESFEELDVGSEEDSDEEPDEESDEGSYDGSEEDSDEESYEGSEEDSEDEELHLCTYHVECETDVPDYDLMLRVMLQVPLQDHQEDQQPGCVALVQKHLHFASDFCTEETDPVKFHWDDIECGMNNAPQSIGHAPPKELAKDERSSKGWWACWFSWLWSRDQISCQMMTTANQ